MDVTGAVPLDPFTCSPGELAGDKVWDLGGTLIFSLTLRYVQSWVLLTHHFFTPVLVWGVDFGKSVVDFSFPGGRVSRLVFIRNTFLLSTCHAIVH